MKLTARLVAAFAGLATAAPPVGQVYLVPAREAEAHSTTSALLPGLARLVLLQRLAPRGQGPSSGDFPRDVGIEEAVSALNQFGKRPPALFTDNSDGEPSQLVMLLAGLSEAQMEDLGHALETKPAFTISDPPSSSAHDDLVNVDLHSRGATNGNNCDMRQMASPLECWTEQQSVGTVTKYDVDKDPEVLDQVLQKLAQFSELGKVGRLETAIVLLPWTTSSESWSDQPLELRRRQAEQVMNSVDKTATPPAPTSSAAEKTILYASRGPVAACFTSEESCVSATGNCSAHGSCLNKYAQADGSDGERVCYACHCLSTRSESGSLTHWAGSSCAKQDISVTFWLLAGVTLALAGILSLAVAMLFNIGEEKLPGVIGAGVSRSN